MPPDNQAKKPPNADATWAQMRRALKKEAPSSLVRAKRHIEHIASLSRRFG